MTQNTGVKSKRRKAYDVDKRRAKTQAWRPRYPTQDGWWCINLKKKLNISRYPIQYSGILMNEGSRALTVRLIEVGCMMLERIHQSG